ncbi:MAG TPA: PaaI family thioesterase [Acidimicrobiales bacterium]
MPAIELSALLDAMPFARYCGVELVAATPDEVEGRLAWSEDRCTANGRLHGGALMTLGDTVGAACAFVNLPDGASTATIESKTNFIRGVDRGTATAIARPLHVGGRFIVVQTAITDSGGELVAQITQTQAVLRS